MKILFLFSIGDFQSSQKPLPNQESMQLGISYISALLKSKNHETDLFVITKSTGDDALLEVIQKYNPQVICATSVSTEFEFIKERSELIKSKLPQIYFIIGGPHASLNPEKVLAGPFDAVCIGEGEYPTLELVEQLQSSEVPHNIKNVWIKNDTSIEKNSTREFNKDLDALPFPDRKIWERWINLPNTRIPILIGRGCPFQCSYCCNHALRKLSEGSYVRYRSPENILAELNFITKEDKTVTEIYLEIETFGANIQKAIDICKMLQNFNLDRAEKIRFGVNIRVAPNIDCNLLFEEMKKAHFNQINIGLESGSPKIREKVLRRYYSNEEFLKVVRLAKEKGFKVYVNILVGIPGETKEDFHETIKCCRESQPDWVFPYIFYPYPGTDLYKHCEETGLLNKKLDSRNERKKAVLDLPGFSKHQIQREFNLAYYNIYKHHRPLMLLLGLSAYRTISSNYWLNSLYRRVSSNKIIKKIEQRSIRGIIDK